MSETLFESVRQWLHELTKPDDEELDEIDIEYLQSDRVQYRYLTVKDEASVRCDICGKQMSLEDMPDMFQHVGKHDGQGSAEIDPTEPSPDAEIGEVEISEQGEPAVI